MKYPKNYESKSVKVVQNNSKTFKEDLSGPIYEWKKQRIYKSHRSSSSENRHRFKRNMSKEMVDITLTTGLKGKEREKIIEDLEALEDWLYEDEEGGGANAELSVYQDKRKSMTNRVKAIFTRLVELEKRPKALQAARDVLIIGCKKNKTPKIKIYKNKNKFPKKKLTFLERKLKREEENIKKVNKLGFKRYDDIMIGINNYLYKCRISKISEKFITLKFKNDEEENYSLKNLIIMTIQANYLKEREKKRKEYRLRARIKWY
jgi:hypothetical protein